MDRRIQLDRGSATARLRDVAERAGVHISTASRALDPGKASRISAEIIERVRAAAAALGYQPNAIAASLRTRRTRTVGVMVPDLNNPMFPPIFRGIEDRLGEIGYSAFLTNSDFNLEREWRILDVFVKRQVDGLILATARLEDPIVRAAVARDMSVVLVNRYTEAGEVSSVVADEHHGINEAFALVYGLGHRRIAHIAGPQDVSSGHARCVAFLEAAQRHGLDASRAVAFADQFTEAAGRFCARSLLTADPRPTAIVAANDILALGVYDALADLGLSCPRDVSVTGFNDMPFVDKLRPALTSVRIPHYRLGYEAADELARRLKDPGAAVIRRVLPPHLVIRESTAPPPEPAR